MGNTQSHSVVHHKLSKPKTNKNSPFSSPKAASPVLGSSGYVDFSARDRQLLRAQLTSSDETDFGSGLSSDGENRMGELATHVQSRLSNRSSSNPVASQYGTDRTSTTKLSSLSGSRLSLVSSTQHVDLDTAIKILREIRKNASPEDLEALHQALQPPSPSPSPRTSQDLNRRPSFIKRSASALIRRRSLVATPGLATRHSPSDVNRKTWSAWRAPQTELQKEQKWVDTMGTSPPTRLAALDLAEDREAPSTPRAQTPGDMDYSHLGTLKLGSLVVTNGAASPAPSTRASRRRSNPNLSQEEDLTAYEGSLAPVRWKSVRKWGHSKSKSSVALNTTPLHRNLSISDEIRRAKSTSRCDSPLKVETRNRFYDDSEAETMKSHLRVINRSADTLAKAYMAEIPNSPFENPREGSAEYHDEGFADSSSDDSVSFQEDAFRILEGTIFSDPATAVETPTPTHVIDISEMRKKRKKTRSGRPVPKKADSGYSSGGSVRTVHREATQEGTAYTISKKPSAMADMLKSGNGFDRDDTVSLYTFEQMLSLPISKKPLPMLLTDESVDAQPVSVQIPEITIGHHHASSISMFSSLGTPGSITSQFTTDSKASTQKRLQKRHLSTPELPVVQSCQPVTQGTIPNIPDNVRAQFVRRLSASPAMECLTQTYLSKEHVNSLESDIDSSITICLEPPSPPASPKPRARKHTRSKTNRPPTPPPHGTRRSLSLFRSKSTVEMMQEADRELENTAPTTVDFGTIVSALGQSPYDFAMSTLPQKPVISPTHPHQLGNALPRAKSMANMDDETAVEFARTRSKDRAHLRSKSYYDTYLEAGEAIAARRHPHSTHPDMPDMPAMPALPALPVLPVLPAIELSKSSLVCDSSPRIEEEDTVSAETKPGPSFRPRSTGRGPVVSELIDKYDTHGRKIPESAQQDWEHHACLWSQRRKSAGVGLRQREEDSQVSSSMPYQRASTQPPEDMMAYDRYSGGLDYGYERGLGISGSAGIRQPHSYASRKSMHFSNQFGVDLSDVPVFMQRA